VSRAAALFVGLALVLGGVSTGLAAPAACPAGDAPFAPMFTDAALFEHAIAAVAGEAPVRARLTGITVPHHLLAADLVARGVRAAAASRYRRIVLLAPDHFRGTTKPFATTARAFGTVFGPVEADAEAVAALLARDDLVEDSCLFSTEHGIHALLPFLRRAFPDAAIVPVAMSVRSRRAEWDALARLLLPLLNDDTLVVESTDFSHFLPQHMARTYDQQTLNVLAAGDLDAIAGLRQPQHADSVGALYVQTLLQARRHGAAPVVVANANSQDYAEAPARETTSYMVILYGPPQAIAAAGPYGPHGPYYIAGDTFFGRAMKLVLLDEDARARARAAVSTLTGGRPLIVNLEGVILPDVPGAIDHMTLAMPEALAVGMLKALGVVGVSLANNHAMDLGASGQAETRGALARAGIGVFGQGETLSLPGLDITGLSDLGANGDGKVDLLTPALLDRLMRPDARVPVVAFVHWGREYETQPSPRALALADAMRLRGVALIVGGHPHVASDGLTALAGGEALLAYSVGNFLFDQTAQRSSGAMIEIRPFAQGTLFARRIPLPHLFDLASGSPPAAAR
jgi:poly-gamma-glutamate synthesis protein (capsule biosynthesis protein)